MHGNLHYCRLVSAAPGADHILALLKTPQHGTRMAPLHRRVRELSGAIGEAVEYVTLRLQEYARY